jgi:hypothetical protein
MYLTEPTKRALQRYRAKGFTDLSDEDVVRTFRRLEQRVTKNVLVTHLNRLDVNSDIYRLEKLFAKARYEISRLDKFFERVGGNPAKFKLFVDYLHEFKGLPIESIKPTYFNNLSREFADINMQHILDKHTVKYFQFIPDNLGTTVHMFPAGTTQAQVCSYIDEALNILRVNRGSIYPIPNLAENVTLSSGMIVRIGSKVENGVKVIGQFYPLPSNGILEFSQEELRAFRKVITNTY